MSKKTLEPRGSFIAHDSEGNAYQINMSVWVETFHSSSGGGREEGSTNLTTDDGLDVTRLKIGVYEILFDDGKAVRVTSDDPNAP